MKRSSPTRPGVELWSTVSWYYFTAHSIHVYLSTLQFVYTEIFCLPEQNIDCSEQFTRPEAIRWHRGCMLTNLLLLERYEGTSWLYKLRDKSFDACARHQSRKWESSRFYASLILRIWSEENLVSADIGDKCTKSFSLCALWKMNIDKKGHRRKDNIMIQFEK